MSPLKNPYMHLKINRKKVVSDEDLLLPHSDRNQTLVRNCGEPEPQDIMFCFCFRAETETAGEESRTGGDQKEDEEVERRISQM